MAKIKWSAFPPGTTIDGADSVVGEQSGVNVIWTWSQVLTYIAGGGATFLAGNGSAGSPSYSFASDTNTGFYRAFGDQIEVSAGGVRRMTFSTAELGIAGIQLSLYDASFTNGAFLTRPAAATLQLGVADAASPVAQTLQVQSVVAGTSNTAGADWTFKGSASTGNAVGGALVFETTPPGGSGTSQNSYNNKMTFTTLSDGTLKLHFNDAGFGVFTIWSASNLSSFGANNGPQLAFRVNSSLPCVAMAPAYPFGFAANNSGTFLSDVDTMLTRAAAATWQLGNVDADTNALIVAQTLRSQGLRTGGTNNQAGKDWTFIASPGKGTGAGGSFLFQTAPAGGSGNTPNAAATMFTISTVGALSAGYLSAGTAPSGIQSGDMSAARTSVNGALFLGSDANSYIFRQGGVSVALVTNGDPFVVPAVVNVASGTATPAHGSTSAVLLFGTTSGFGIYYGSDTPTVSAAKGSLYLRSDGTGVADRAYINTNGSTTWAAIATAA